MTEFPVRIAMWSGPRNISTALMRAWENRPDTVVHDEPFYAHYLMVTGLDHPGRDEIIAAYETDWRKVVAQITREPLPPGKTIYYQKHMTHHILPHMTLDWMTELTNCFLIRHPQEVITSYIKVRPEVTLDDIGFSQQWRLFQFVREATDQIPPVLDARDVLEDPKAMLVALCQAVGVDFDERMLSWPPGRRDSDGIWAKYWYAAVERSTGFAPYRPKTEQVPAHLQDVLEEATEIYAALHAYRLGQ